MDIHAHENNLGIIENSFEGKNTYSIEDNLPENIQNDTNQEDIHDSKVNNDRQNMDFNNNKYQKLLHEHKRYLGNGIMRHIFNERYSKSSSEKVKQIIKSERKASILLSKKVKLPKVIMNTIKPNNTIKPKPNEKLINNDNNLSETIDTIVIDIDNNFEKIHIKIDKNQHQQFSEDPPKIDLCEIIESVLQDVSSNLKECNSIENVIGKLRMKYEEKKEINNKDKKSVILLIFDDDTIRPVLKIEEKYMNIIEEWYNKCNLFFDIEETNLFIPKSITITDLSNVYLPEINYKDKDNFLNNYLQLAINNIISEKKLLNLKNIFLNNEDNTLNKPSQHLNNFYIYDNDDDDVVVYIPNDGFNSYNSKKKTDKEIEKNISSDDLTDQHDKILEKMGIKMPELLKSKNKSLNDENENDNENENENKNKNKNDTTYCPEYYTIHDLKCYDYAYAYENDILSYNFSKFGVNCEVIETENKYKRTKEKSQSIYVLINAKFLQTLSIKNPDKDVLYVINNHPEFGFIKLFEIKTENNDIISFIGEKFNNINFNNIDEVNNKLTMTSQFIEFTNSHTNTTHNLSSEELKVKDFLIKKFNIDNDINNKMKASVLYDVIIKANVVKFENNSNNNISGFRTRLSKYLKDIGLQKKRYNDGFYYYGIVEKKQKTINSFAFINKDFNLTALIQKREEELKNFFETPTPINSFPSSALTQKQEEEFKNFFEIVK